MTYSLEAWAANMPLEWFYFHNVGSPDELLAANVCMGMTATWCDNTMRFCELMCDYCLQHGHLAEYDMYSEVHVLASDRWWEIYFDANGMPDMYDGYEVC